MPDVYNAFGDVITHDARKNQAFYRTQSHMGLQTYRGFRYRQARPSNESKVLALLTED